MIRLIKLLVLTCWMLVPISALAAPVVAELVWFETNEQKRQIRYASYSDDQWTVQQAPIYETDNLISGPAISTKNNGDKMLFWSEDNAGAVVLMVMKGVKKSQAILWDKPSILHDKYQENLGASAVVDLENNVWLVWSASGLKPSDIKLIKLTDKGWSKVEDVHQKNNTPDVLPTSYLNANGDVVIEWQQFDKTQFSHVTKFKVYSAVKPKKSDIENMTRVERGLGDIDSPNFISQDQHIVIHFPQNRRNQSQALMR